MTRIPTPPEPESRPTLPPSLGDRYLAALDRLGPAPLRDLLQRLGVEAPSRSSALSARVSEALESYEVFSPALAGLEAGPLAAAGIFRVTERAEWSAADLTETLALLGHEPIPALRPLIELGAVAVEWPDGAAPPADPWSLDGSTLLAHPSLAETARPGRPATILVPEVEEARQIREADGLEVILRIAALWQRLADGPLKLTIQESLFKRDRDRLDRDEALTGPISDSVGSPAIPSLADLWLELARSVGLVTAAPKGDQLNAAPRSTWQDLGVHLPQMLAARWLSCRTDHSPIPSRLSSLLRLATLPTGNWARLDSLGDPRPAPRATRKGQPDETPGADQALATAYILGLVRLAESVPSRVPLAQLTDQGRYVLGLGPPPPPLDRPDQFLFMQPNFDVIAYRQGLSVPRIADLAMVADIVQVGSAIGLRLTKESVHRGLQQGVPLASLEGWLTSHAVRAIPSGVAQAIRSWSERRDRISYHSSSTLLEFPDAPSLESALATWPVTEGRPGPVRVADRLLLIEDEGQIPFTRFRLSGSRDYRQPPEQCVAVSDDGLTLSIDPARGDLFVEAEILRFADPTGSDSAGSLARSFLVSVASLRRAGEEGFTASALEKWFQRRAGSGLPASVRLLWRGTNEAGDIAPLRTARRWILRTSSSEVLEGLLQHPATAPWIDERLGPDSASITEGHLERLRKAVGPLGIRLAEDPEV